jgi:regulatory protein
MRPRSDAPAPDARTLAVRLLTRRDYTTVELRRKLLERGCPAEEADASIADLTSQGLLDDRRIAAAHVRTSARIKGRGRLRIRRELEERGIPRALAQELLAELPEDDEAAAIDRFLARKRFPAKPTPVERRRAFQQLLRRGFGADAIATALRKRGLPEE